LSDAELYGIADWPPIARILNGWAQRETEEPDREVDNILSIGNRYAGPYWSFTVAQTERALGKFDAAIARIDQALSQSDELGVLYYVPELYRLKGECLSELALAEDSPSRANEARATFERAIETARDQRSRLPELRATLGLAKLLVRQDSDEQARGRLAPITNWFTEGLDAPELIEARNFLNR
jgi:tetratricopeptide (TPR) repeat protein